MLRKQNAAVSIDFKLSRLRFARESVGACLVQSLATLRSHSVRTLGLCNLQNTKITLHHHLSLISLIRIVQSRPIHTPYEKSQAEFGRCEANYQDISNDSRLGSKQMARMTWPLTSVLTSRPQKSARNLNTS